MCPRFSRSRERESPKTLGLRPENRPHLPTNCGTRVDGALVSRKVELVFDPFDMARIEVRYEHRPFGLATPLVIGRRTYPRAEREIAPPPTPTGIDYLRLLAERRDAELGGHRIDYASLANNGDGDGDDRDTRGVERPRAVRYPARK